MRHLMFPRYVRIEFQQDRMVECQRSRNMEMTTLENQEVDRSRGNEKKRIFRKARIPILIQQPAKVIIYRLSGSDSSFRRSVSDGLISPLNPYKAPSYSRLLFPPFRALRTVQREDSMYTLSRKIARCWLAPLSSASVISVTAKK